MFDLDIEISAGPVRPISTTLFDATPNIVSAPCFLYGWSIREFSGAATVTLELKSGEDQVAEIFAAASSVDTRWLGPMGVYCRGGLKLVTVSGQWTGTIYAAFLRAG
jgi:hypothetical protein